MFFYFLVEVDYFYGWKVGLGYFVLMEGKKCVQVVVRGVWISFREWYLNV